MVYFSRQLHPWRSDATDDVLQFYRGHVTCSMNLAVVPWGLACWPARWETFNASTGGRTFIFGAGLFTCSLPTSCRASIQSTLTRAWGQFRGRVGGWIRILLKCARKRPSGSQDSWRGAAGGHQAPDEFAATSVRNLVFMPDETTHCPPSLRNARKALWMRKIWRTANDDNCCRDGDLTAGLDWTAEMRRRLRPRPPCPVRRLPLWKGCFNLETSHVPRNLTGPLLRYIVCFYRPVSPFSGFSLQVVRSPRARAETLWQRFFWKKRFG